MTNSNLFVLLCENNRIINSRNNKFSKVWEELYHGSLLIVACHEMNKH